MKPKPTFYAHPTAIIDEGAVIGTGSKVWHFSHIMPNSIIGENCILGQNTFVASKVEIGNNCKIQNNVSLYEGVKIHDNVFIGPSVVFTNVINPRSFIERKTEYKETLIHQGASVGANVTVVCGVSLGEYSLIGAGSTVTKNVEPHALYYGVPAVFQGWVSKAGHRLVFENNIAKCPETGEKYKLVNNHIYVID